MTMKRMFSSRGNRSQRSRRRRVRTLIAAQHRRAGDEQHFSGRLTTDQRAVVFGDHAPLFWVVVHTFDAPGQDLRVMFDIFRADEMVLAASITLRESVIDRAAVRRLIFNYPQ